MSCSSVPGTADADGGHRLGRRRGIGRAIAAVLPYPGRLRSDSTVGAPPTGPRKPFGGRLDVPTGPGCLPVANEFEPGLSVLIAACWLRAGQPEHGTGALDRARQRNPRATVQIGGKEVALSAEVARCSARLRPPPPREGPQQWLVFRGNAARNASTESSGPLLSTVWRVPTTDQPYVETAIEEVQQSFREQISGRSRASHPLVVNNLVLMRTASNLVAVDLVDGKTALGDAGRGSL